MPRCKSIVESASSLSKSGMQLPCGSGRARSIIAPFAGTILWRSALNANHHKKRVVPRSAQWHGAHATTPFTSTAFLDGSKRGRRVHSTTKIGPSKSTVNELKSLLADVCNAQRVTRRDYFTNHKIIG